MFFLPWAGPMLLSLSYTRSRYPLQSTALDAVCPG